MISVRRNDYRQEWADHKITANQKQGGKNFLNSLILKAETQKLNKLFKTKHLVNINKGEEGCKESCILWLVLKGWCKPSF